MCLCPCACKRMCVCVRVCLYAHAPRSPPLPSLAPGQTFFGHEESNEKINEISGQTYGSAGEAGRCCDKVLCIFVMRGRDRAPPGRAVSYRASQDAGSCTGWARLAESDTDACSSSIMASLELTLFFPDH